MKKLWILALLLAPLIVQADDAATTDRAAIATEAQNVRKAFAAGFEQLQGMSAADFDQVVTNLNHAEYVGQKAQLEEAYQSVLKKSSTNMLAIFSYAILVLQSVGTGQEIPEAPDFFNQGPQAEGGLGWEGAVQLGIGIILASDGQAAQE